MLPIPSEKWMSWQEIADRLQVMIKEQESRLSPTGVSEWWLTKSIYVKEDSRNMATIALDIVALRHMHALAVNYAKAFKKEER